MSKKFIRKTKESKPVVAICYDFDKIITSKFPLFSELTPNFTEASIVIFSARPLLVHSYLKNHSLELHQQ